MVRVSGNGAMNDTRSPRKAEGLPAPVRRNAYPRTGFRPRRDGFLADAREDQAARVIERPRADTSAPAAVVPRDADRDVVKRETAGTGCENAHHAFGRLSTSVPSIALMLSLSAGLHRCGYVDTSRAVGS